MAKFRTNASLRMVDNLQLQEAIRTHIRKKATKTYAQVQQLVDSKVKKLIKENLTSSNVVMSVINGKLRGDFGLSFPAAKRAVDRIVNYISENIELSVKYSYRGKNVATFSLNLLPMGVKELSMLPEGNYTSTGKFGGGDVSWLTWLLTKGTQVVVGDFYVFDEPEGKTRSGDAVMQKANKNGQPFRVDSGFSGTEDDNFVTRALEPIIPQIKNEIFIKMKEGLK